MSPRKKRHARRKGNRQDERIAWLEHRRGYPSDEEREAIVARRMRLHMELVELMILGKGPNTPEGKALIERYGQDEVDRLVAMMDSWSPDLIRVGSGVRAYRMYRQRFARYGGKRPFLSRQDYDRFSEEHAALVSKRIREALDEEAEQLTDDDRARRDELADLLLLGEIYWSDLIPPRPPLRPQDDDAPPMGTYAPPVSELLEWGHDFSYERVLEAASEPERWKGSIGDLTRMVLDPGLLDGWPGEPASWAPWHALYLLSALNAWEVALTLADLADRPNDWLSDCLPEVWAVMGTEVEPLLWMLVDDAGASQYRRSLGVYGLYFLLDSYPVYYEKMGREFVARLQSTSQEMKMLNASLVHVFTLMGYEDALPAIKKAFADEKVDSSYITLEDVEETFYEGDEEE